MRLNRKDHRGVDVAGMLGKFLLCGGLLFKILKKPMKKLIKKLQK